MRQQTILRFRNCEHMVNLSGFVLPGRIKSQTPQQHVPFPVHLWCIKTLAPAVYKQGERLVVDLCGLDADRLPNECSPRNEAGVSEHGNMILPIFQIVFQVKLKKKKKKLITVCLRNICQRSLCLILFGTFSAQTSSCFCTSCSVFTGLFGFASL